jgi:hypothetical protein
MHEWGLLPDTSPELEAFQCAGVVLAQVDVCIAELEELAVLDEMTAFIHSVADQTRPDMARTYTVIEGFRLSRTTSSYSCHCCFCDCEVDPDDVDEEEEFGKRMLVEADDTVDVLSRRDELLAHSGVSS